MCTTSGSKIADIAAECISRLNEEQTDNCISHLLDLSVRHGSNFDWAVAHIGGSFPQIVIMRVLIVGLKSQKEMAKVNSAVGILNHLGATHKSEIKVCVLKLLNESEDPLVIPYLLNLSSLSDLMASLIMSVATGNFTKFSFSFSSNLIIYSLDLYRNHEIGVRRENQ